MRQARRALGYRSQEAFGLAVGVSERRISGIERAEKGIGPSVLEAVGFFLSQHLVGWGIDTPRLILEGGPVPELILIDPDQPAKARLDVVWTDAKVEIRSLASHSEELRTALREILHLRKKFGTVGLTDSRLLDAIEQALKDLFDVTRRRHPER